EIVEPGREPFDEADIFRQQHGIVDVPSHRFANGSQPLQMAGGPAVGEPAPGANTGSGGMEQSQPAAGPRAVLGEQIRVVGSADRPAEAWSTPARRADTTRTRRERPGGS